MKNNRYADSLSPHLKFSKNPHHDLSTKILCSPSDEGVIRNFGRNGSQYAPESILNCLKKMNRPAHFNQQTLIHVSQITSQKEQKINFEQSQQDCVEFLTQNIFSGPVKSLIHLGGGHDHIFPLLKALELNEAIKNILIINLDAHCDTRQSQHSHSGTPFRDFDRIVSKPCHLLQLGIHSYANSSSTLSPLQKIKSDIYFFEEIQKISNNFEEIPLGIFSKIPFSISKDTAFVLSLDCDGIDGSQMPAVSAINSLGLPISFVHKFIHYMREQAAGLKALGVYEFNPVYDHSSLYGLKNISHLIYEFMRE